VTLSGSARRRKGHVGERQLATKLREAFPEFAAAIKRGLQAQTGGRSNCDVQGLPGFHIEHKSQKKPNMKAAYEQAVRDADGKGFPLAVVQCDNARERLCVIGLTDLCRILRAAYGHTGPLRFGVQGELFDEPLSEEKAAE
jgi:hypothetical protein